jgi:hypothetical protein
MSYMMTAGPDSIMLVFEGAAQSHAVYPGNAHLPRKLVEDNGAAAASKPNTGYLQRLHITTLIRPFEQHSRQQQHQQAAGQQQQQQQQEQQHTEALSGRPLPWRALHHLLNMISQSSSNTRGGALLRQAPAYLVSAFLDTRPMMTGHASEIAVIMAVDKRVSPVGWRCLVQLQGSTGSSSSNISSLAQWAAAAGSGITLNMAVRYSVGNNEHFFNFQATTAFCQLPQDLQEALLAEQSTSSSGQSLQLKMTVVGPAGSSTDTAPPSPPSHAWVPVELVPRLTAEEQAAYPAGKGSVAVCAPPIHTDAYAATLIAWQAFQQQMGVQQVFMYSFNPGPLIKPLMDFYESTGAAEVHEWIIPASILQDQQQECLLPFFHPSAARERYGSPRCTYHQVCRQGD